MRDTLNPGELAFLYGTDLQPNSGTSVEMQIITEKEGDDYTSVKFQITFEIDPTQAIPYNRQNVPPREGKNYQVNYNEVGFAEDAQLCKSAKLSQMYVSFQNNSPMLNLSVAMTDGVKRDSETYEQGVRAAKARLKALKK